MKKILIAEGEKVYRSLSKEALEAEGCVVSLAATGKEALEKIRDVKPDVVILDMHLPGGGIKTLGQIREGGQGPSVIVTARCHPCDESFLVWRAEEWVVKSKDLSVLKAAVRRLLAARAAKPDPVPAIDTKQQAGQITSAFSPGAERQLHCPPRRDSTPRLDCECRAPSMVEASEVETRIKKESRVARKGLLRSRLGIGPRWPGVDLDSSCAAPHWELPGT